MISIMGIFGQEMFLQESMNSKYNLTISFSSLYFFRKYVGSERPKPYDVWVQKNKNKLELSENKQVGQVTRFNYRNPFTLFRRRQSLLLINGIV